MRKLSIPNDENVLSALVRSVTALNLGAGTWSDMLHYNISQSTSIRKKVALPIFNWSKSESSLMGSKWNLLTVDELKSGNNEKSTYF